MTVVGVGQGQPQQFFGPWQGRRRIGGGPPGSARIRDSSRRTAICPRPGGPRFRSRRARRRGRRPCSSAERDHVRAGARQRGDRRQRIHDLMGQHPHQVGLGRNFQRAELALHRQDRQDRHSADRAARHGPRRRSPDAGTPSISRRVILRVPGGSSRRRGQLRARAPQDPRARANGCRANSCRAALLSSSSRPSSSIASKALGQIVDDGRQIAGFADAWICRA